MNIETQVRIRNNPNLYRYLRENSSWYKLLNRDPSCIKNIEEEMKKKYKLNPIDKIEDLSKKLGMFKMFMDVFQ